MDVLIHVLIRLARMVQNNSATLQLNHRVYRGGFLKKNWLVLAGEENFFCEISSKIPLKIYNN